MTTGELCNTVFPSEQALIEAVDREMSKLEEAYVKLQEKAAEQKGIIRFLWTEVQGDERDW